MYRQQQHHAVTDFSTGYSQEENAAVGPASEGEWSLDGTAVNRSIECDRISTRCDEERIPRKMLRDEWKKVAEVLDRLFFYLFFALLVIPTTTILGVVRLFKPDLTSQ
jgi:hypothetical protein